VRRTVHLSLIVDGLEMQSDNQSSYLDLATGQIELVTDDDLRAAEEEDSLEEDEDEVSEAEWEGIDIARAILADPESKRFLPLPSSFDIHEYAIMEDFARSLENPDLSDRLCAALRGNGAFRRFKEFIHEHGIVELWYRFRADALREIAIDWCEANQLEYDEEDEPEA